jgi:hypothetical protein
MIVQKKLFTEDLEGLKDRILAACCIRQMAGTLLRFLTAGKRHGTKGALERFLPALYSFNRSRGLAEYPM